MLKLNMEVRSSGKRVQKCYRKLQQADCTGKRGWGRGHSGIDAIFKIAIDVFCKIVYILIDYVSNVNVTAENFFFLY